MASLNDFEDLPLSELMRPDHLGPLSLVLVDQVAETVLASTSGVVPPDGAMPPAITGWRCSDE